MGFYQREERVRVHIEVIVDPGVHSVEGLPEFYLRAPQLAALEVVVGAKRPQLLVDVGQPGCLPESFEIIDARYRRAVPLVGLRGPYVAFPHFGRQDRRYLVVDGLDGVEEEGQGLGIRAGALEDDDRIGAVGRPERVHRRLKLCEPAFRVGYYRNLGGRRTA